MRWKKTGKKIVVVCKKWLVVRWLLQGDSGGLEKDRGLWYDFETVVSTIGKGCRNGLMMELRCWLGWRKEAEAKS